MFKPSLSDRARLSFWLLLALAAESLYVLYAFWRAGVFVSLYKQQGVITSLNAYPGTLWVLQIASFCNVHGLWALLGLLLGLGVCLWLAYRRYGPRTGRWLLAGASGALAMLALFINLALFQPLTPHAGQTWIVPVTFFVRPV